MQIPNSTLATTVTDPNQAATSAAPQAATTSTTSTVQSNTQPGIGDGGYKIALERPGGYKWSAWDLKTSGDYVPPAIDRWLSDHGLNRFGDPIGMRYPGGTPLFNRETGQSIPRLDYILNKHPHLACFVPNKCYPMPSPWMPSPSPMPPGLNFPGAEKVKAMLEQLMKTISGLLGALFPSQPQPRPLPPPILYPTPPVVDLPGMPGNQRRLHRQIRQVSREIRSVKQEIRMYERAGRPVPRQLTQKLKFLEQRLAKLQAQVNPPFDRPGFPEFGIPKPFRPGDEKWLLNGDTITSQTAAPAEQAVQPASVNTTPTPSTTSQTVGNS